MLKRTIITYKTGKNIKHHRPQEMIDFKSSNRFAIIYSDQFEKEDNLKEMIKDLEGLGKEVNVMVYCHQPKKKITDLPFYTSLDINYSGQINSSELQSFVDQSYDFALCLDESRHFLIDYVFSLIKSKCRVGTNGQEQANRFDLMIHSSKENIPLCSEVIRYLKMIQNNEYQPV